MERTIAMVEKLKTSEGEGGGEATASAQNMEGVWGGNEGITSFLELLENNDDIESYDIFEDGDVEDETQGEAMEIEEADEEAEGPEDETEEAEYETEIVEE